MARRSDANATALKRLLVFFLGCVFGVSGLALVVSAIGDREDMMKPPEVVYVPHGRADGRGSHSISGGFEPGLRALFGMLLFGVGGGIAAGGATSNPEVLRTVAAILALVWHGVGIGTCWCYCLLASKLDVWSFLAVTVYEWVGLIPLVLAIPRGGRTERFHSAVCYAMLGGFVGAIAGAVLGGVVGGIAVLVSSAKGSGVAGTDWWLYTTVGSALVACVVFALLRLNGWEVPSDDQKPPERPTAPSAVRRRFLRPRPLCFNLGIACFAGVLGLYFFHTWQTFKESDSAGWNCLMSLLNLVLGGRIDLPNRLGSTAQTYMFWLLFFGGWTLTGISRLLPKEDAEERAGNDADRPVRRKDGR